MPLLLKDRAVTASPLPLITTAEARMLGISLTPSIWRRVRRGIYVNAHDYRALAPWQRYAVRVHAYARLHPDSILVLESAGVVHGLPHFDETALIHVLDPRRARSRRFGDVFVHTSFTPRTVIRIRGVLVTSMLDTVADLARVLPPAHTLAVVDSAISPAQGGPLTLDQLRTLAATQGDRRGGPQQRWAWDHADALAESPAETISRAVIAWSGFETPVLQKVFNYEGVVDRTDFFFPSNGAVGESDGWEKYQLDDRKAAVKALTDEKKREDRLRRHGHPFARWDLSGAEAVKPMVNALLATGLRRVAAPREHLLASLKTNPRAVPKAVRRPS